MTSQATPPTRLTGREAIDYAEEHGLILDKHADPIEGAREGLTVAEAKRVAAEDPGLIYIDVRPTWTHELVPAEGEHFGGSIGTDGKITAVPETRFRVVFRQDGAVVSRSVPLARETAERLGRLRCEKENGR